MDLGQSLQQPLTLCAQDSIFVCKPQTSNLVLTILYAHITGNSLALKSSFHVSASGPRSGLVLVTLIRDVYLKSIFKYFFFDVFVFVFEEFFEKVFLDWEDMATNWKILSTEADETSLIDILVLKSAQSTD